MENITIKALGLTKKFGDFTAVDNVNLSVNRGEIFGFLGPNGAGKTTTIRMLTGVLKPTSGKVEILGLDMKDHETEIKRKIGVVPDEPKIYEHLKGYEFLDFVIAIYRLNKQELKNRIEELCNAFGVDYLSKFVGEMSHGMKQKLMLISVLMRKPEVLFLDEPTVGLDARSAKILKELLRKYADEGTTIFMTTHILEIAEKMCDRVAIINKGQIIAESYVAELKEKHGKSLEDIFLSLTATEDIRDIVENL
ncbi:ABC transporter [Fervidobacterium sp. SC_NGM5_O18]|uniref:ABC transporter n=1 Tax=Fervidobacterium pennivorans TaxID=93466 RepID=A0A172T232_FERPE|nr:MULTISPECIES: ABC transporter ATP-binding protein [Fervidobacterium]ANE41058.1 ABC transporter [Fervidobacterium pennivorans]MDM7320431.1 ABC transporter ATP-binding protein [Fervidobacterium sp.]NPU88892.1 ABC transporter ATP-binding protein [Fervidobacterium sp.]PHJ12573.1 ABC transporter [Fervidobacterium sp. SC_NGM5_O18]